MFEKELFICIKMDLALNSLQRLIYYQTQTTQSISTKVNRFPPWWIPDISLNSCWNIGAIKNKHYLWLLEIKKQIKSKPYLENKAAKFLRFIVLESLKETYQDKLSPFLEKVISGGTTPWTMKKKPKIEICSWIWTTGGILKTS